jgi:surface polysaccharide O-acyltransferase-like enzyme
MIQYDAIRLIAILAIVLLHTAANGVSSLTPGSSDWWLANIADSASRVGVPLFLMLTGATLLARPYGSTTGTPSNSNNTSNSAPISAVRQFYRRRLQRLALPVLAWSLIYLLWAQLKAHWKHQPLALSDQLSGLLSGHNYFHLWFIYLLLGLYATLPLWRFLWQQLTPQQQGYSTLLALGLQQGLLLLRFHSDSSIPDWLVNADSLPWPLWFIAYLPYLMLGALLHPADVRAQTTQMTPSAHRWQQLAPLLLLLTLCLLVATTAWLYAWQQQNIGPEPFYYAYHRLSLPVMLSALCIWLMLRHSVSSQMLSSQMLSQPSAANQQLSANEKPSLTRQLSKLIVHCSFGIYLVHPIFLDLSQALLQYSPLHQWPYPILLPLQTLFIASASLASCLLWQYLWKYLWQHLRQKPHS